MNSDNPESPTSPGELPHPDDVHAWHRLPCDVFDGDGNHSGIIVSGDLHGDPDVARAQLAEWVVAGTGGIVDCRMEWTDETFVADHFPQVTYVHVGVDDHGGSQPDEWFDLGVQQSLAVLERGDRVVIHCHMGINRGPSMAFAVLLALGWPVTAALDALLDARPIVGLLYAEDAISWYGRREGWTPEQVANAQAELTAWLERTGVDPVLVIRRMRGM